MSESESRGTVVFALVSNLIVAVAKIAAGVIGGSSAMLAEGAHSVADTTNQLFLLASLRRSAQPADDTHPFGYGKERFFWSLLAAVGIFVSGAAFSVYEGVHGLLSGASAHAEGFATTGRHLGGARGRARLGGRLIGGTWELPP